MLITTSDTSSAGHVMVTADDVPAHLRRWLDDSPIGSIFRHPLCVQILPTLLPMPLEAYLAERSCARVAAWQASGDPFDFIVRTERPFRMDSLVALASLVPSRFTTPAAAIRFWRAAAWAWMDAEHSETDPIWGTLLAAPVPLRAAMTAAGARRRLAAMPGTLTLYKGVADPDPAHDAVALARTGWSWSLSCETARWFARRGARVSGAVLTARIRRDDVVAFLDARGEDEIVTSPAAVHCPVISETWSH